MVFEHPAYNFPAAFAIIYYIYILVIIHLINIIDQNDRSDQDIVLDDFIWDISLFFLCSLHVSNIGSWYRAFSSGINGHQVCHIRILACPSIQFGAPLVQIFPRLPC